MGYMNALYLWLLNSIIRQGFLKKKNDTERIGPCNYLIRCTDIENMPRFKKYIYNLMSITKLCTKN